MDAKILILEGDGIGPEVIAQAARILELIGSVLDINLKFERALVGGAAIEAESTPLPQKTLLAAKSADAILLGAVGGEQWDNLPIQKRPEKGLLGLRSELELFANLRPGILYPGLISASSLKQSVVEGLDIMIIRELTGGIYFGEPRGVENANGIRRGFNTYTYNETEICRIARIAFEIARKRNKKVCSVDKANVLEVTALWRQVVTEIGQDYSDIELTHMYVDNAAMQLVRAPKQFDVILTGNMFGDILSDIVAMLTGSLGMLPSASLAASKKGMYEPVHGSAPDIAGRDIANPLAAILSAAMMLRYTFGQDVAAAAIEQAVDQVLSLNVRTQDIAPTEGAGDFKILGTQAMGNAVFEALKGILR